MNEQAVIFSKIFAKSSFKFISLFMIGSLLTLICVVTGCVLMDHANMPGSHAAHAGLLGVVFILPAWFAIDFWATLLVVTSLLVFPALYFITAKKAGISTAVHLLYKHKVANWAEAKIQGYLQRLENKSVIKSSADAAALKLKLMDINRKDAQTPKVQKSVLNYLFSKMQFDTVDFQGEPQSLSSIIHAKLSQAINEKTQASSGAFWKVAGCQALLVALAIIF